MKDLGNQITVFNTKDVQNLIYTVRGSQVMLDSNLADLYNVKTGRLNEQVKRNSSRFPKEFMFQLTKEENENLMSQIAVSNNDSLRSQNATLEKGRGEHRKYLPYAFTEQGVAMLSGVLNSNTAVKVSIQIMQAFVGMRKFISNNAGIFQRLDKVERKQLKTDEKFEKIFDALQNKNLIPKQGIFFDGQVFDAYNFVANIIRSAKKSIVLIDNYIDDTVLKLLLKRNSNVNVIIYTKNITKVLQQDLKKHNKQYPAIEIKQFINAHDRFIIIDEKTLYHFGASLKDLGKKWFAFSKMDISTLEILNKLKKD